MAWCSSARSSAIPYQKELSQGVAGPHHLLEGRARLQPAPGQPQRQLAVDEDGRLASAGDGQIQDSLAGLTGAADAISGLGHADSAISGLGHADRPACSSYSTRATRASKQPP